MCACPCLCSCRCGFDRMLALSRVFNEVLFCTDGATQKSARSVPAVARCSTALTDEGQKKLLTVNPPIKEVRD